jgi:hypothetical protein
MSSICINCFVRGETVNNIFGVIIDNDQKYPARLTLINFDHEVNFFNPVFPVTSFTDSLSTKRNNTLIERAPHSQENGERGSVHVPIYPQNK